jgi:hypothetical protein
MGGALGQRAMGAVTAETAIIGEWFTVVGRR